MTCHFFDRFRRKMPLLLDFCMYVCYNYPVIPLLEVENKQNRKDYVMKNFFRLEERGSTVRREAVAGITTFLAMAYILLVNPGMFSALGAGTEAGTGGYFNGVYIATALSAVIGTLLIGFLANLPLAQAPGMGLNAFFVYTVCFGLGFSYANALLFVLFDGVLFVILTVTGLRKLIFEAIPTPVKAAIPAGIGLFIALLGLQDAKLVIPSTSTGLTLSSFNLLGSATWAGIMPLLVTVLALVAIAVLSKKGVKGAILWSILGAAALYYLLGFTVPGFYTPTSTATANGYVTDYFLGCDSVTGVCNTLSLNPFAAFADFGKFSFAKVFTEGFDFSYYLSADGHSTGSLIIAIITTSLAFCMVDMFDTMGTLYGACRAGDMLVKNDKGEEEVPAMDRAMLADAIATCTGAVCGTSTVTTFVESSSGVAAGGRTGLSSVFTAALFAVALFLSPIASLIPACSYAAALIYVGVLMIGSIKGLEWSDPAVAVPSFLTLAMMPFTYNISYGIAFGLISYTLIRLFTGKIREIKPGTWIVSILFAAMFFLTH